MLNMGEKLNQEELEDMMREVYLKEKNYLFILINFYFIQADVNRDGKLDYQGKKYPSFVK